MIGEQLLHLIQNAQVVQVGVDQAADQVLSRNVVSLSGVAAVLLGGVPVIRNGHHHGLAQRIVKGLGRGFLQGGVVGVLQPRFCQFQNVQTIILQTMLNQRDIIPKQLLSERQLAWKQD